MIEKKAITLRLAGWQKRMVMDYLKSDAHMRTVTINVIDRIHWRTYRVPEWEGVRKGEWNLYLTDAQIKEVKAVLGITLNISALNVSPEMVKSEEIVFA